MHTIAGFFQMDCIAVTSAQWIWDLIGPLLGLLALSLLLVWLVLNYRARLLQAWETRHINALKRRFAILSCVTTAPPGVLPTQCNRVPTKPHFRNAAPPSDLYIGCLQCSMSAEMAGLYSHRLWPRTTKPPA